MLRGTDQLVPLAHCGPALSEIVGRRLPLEVDVLARLLDRRVLLGRLVLLRCLVCCVLDFRPGDLVRQVVCLVEVLRADRAIVLVLLQADRARTRCVALRHAVSSWPLLPHRGSLLLSAGSVCRHLSGIRGRRRYSCCLTNVTYGCHGRVVETFLQLLIEILRAKASDYLAS